MSQMYSVWLGETNLCPMFTETRLSRFRRHHCSTSCVQVALKKALRTLALEHARKMVASCSLKPVFPSSKSLSDSSTTSHSTLRDERHVWSEDKHEMSENRSQGSQVTCSGWFLEDPDWEGRSVCLEYWRVYLHRKNTKIRIIKWKNKQTEKPNRKDLDYF